MDGGVRSPTNVDLAGGHDAVLVVAPLVGFGLPHMPRLDSELESLRPGTRVTVISPNEASLAAIGPNVLDPAMRPAAARVGLAQGEHAVDEVLALWSVQPQAPPASR